MYQQITQFNQDAVCEEIKRALEENEPRIEIVTVAVNPVEKDEDDQPNALGVRVVYKIIGNKTETAEFMEEATIRGN